MDPSISVNNNNERKSGIHPRYICVKGTDNWLYVMAAVILDKLSFYTSKVWDIRSTVGIVEEAEKCMSC